MFYSSPKPKPSSIVLPIKSISPANNTEVHESYWKSQDGIPSSAKLRLLSALPDSYHFHRRRNDSRYVDNGSRAYDCSV